MYKYHCLNPISPVGMGQLDANYENTENAADADVILVRSAKMHEMEFGENLKAIARVRCRCEQYSAGSLCRGRDRCI